MSTRGLSADPASSGRRLLVAAAIVVLATLACRAFLVQGLILPLRVAGDSMGDRLPGQHWQVVCQDCGFPFRCGTQHPPADGLAVCPNCGFSGNPLAPRALGSGRRVVIDKWSLWAQTPSRWRVVAIRPPAGPVRQAVKRVVGLPGEQLAIRDGDLYANERIVRKRLDELQLMAVMVHDDRFRMRQAPSSRWQPEASDTRWRDQGGWWAFDPDSAGSEAQSPRLPIDWLVYRHWPCAPVPGPRLREVPVTDNDAYNQGLSRPLNDAHDLMLSAWLKWDEVEVLALRVHDGADKWELWLWPHEGRLQRLHNGRTVRTTGLAPIPGGGWMKLDFALCDRQLLLGLGDRMVYRCLLGAAPAARAGTSRPLAVGVRGGRIQLRALRVLRDVVYTHPDGTLRPWPAPARLAAGELLVLGDNGPVSWDGRHWIDASLGPPKMLGAVRSPTGLW